MTMTGFDLRAERRRLGLSQAKLARRLGVAPNTVARWERGEMEIQHPAMLRARLDQIKAEDA